MEALSEEKGFLALGYGRKIIYIYIYGLNMTQDQRNLGLIHPCLHKQNENRILAFYHMHPELRFRKS